MPQRLVWGSGVSFTLRFDEAEIEDWAARYTYPHESHMTDVVGPRAKRLGYFSKPDFLDLCRWKSPRSQPRAAANCEQFIREVTHTALSTTSEQLRIEVLTLLRGVGWPTASVILHFAHADPYPILDFRALWSLGIDRIPLYDFPFWLDYTGACRSLAQAAGVSMRTLDRALWQYSKVHQPSSSLP
jgi:hypothetical protein